jgi:methionine-rich copper-binding protein CopC
MRRAAILAVGLVVTLAAVSVQAGASIRVENSESAGEKLAVRASSCRSGEGFSAVVHVELVDPATGSVLKSRKVDADPDGSTRLKIKIPGNTQPGTYTARVRCIHEFDAGGQGIFYESEESFEVTP